MKTDREERIARRVKLIIDYLEKALISGKEISPEIEKIIEMARTLTSKCNEKEAGKVASGISEAIMRSKGGEVKSYLVMAGNSTLAILRSLRRERKGVDGRRKRSGERDERKRGVIL